MADHTKLLRQDLAFVNGLLALNGYHPYLRELLIEAKQKMEEEIAQSSESDD